VFFLLLFFVKLTCTGMLLDYAVNETAKEIAASAYPIAFLNEMEGDNPQQYGAGSGEQDEDIISSLLLGRTYEGDEGRLINKALEVYKKGGLGYLKLKSDAKHRLVETLLKEHLDDKLIEQEKLRICLAELPQSEAEYLRNIGSGKYQGLSLLPGQDFGKDDVAIQIEYDYTISLPFVKTLEIKLVHTAVEKAWLAGSFGIITERDEGLDLSSDSTIVYVTRTGIRYHLGSCWYLHSSKIPIEINESKAQGYTPCKVCKPPE